MSEHWNGNGEHYGEELLAALAPEGELWSRRGGRRILPPRGGQRRPQGGQPRPRGGPRKPGAPRGDLARLMLGGGQPRPRGGSKGGKVRPPGGARGRPHGSRCGCARCRRAGGHLAGCDCARCRRGRALIGRLYDGPLPFDMPVEQGSEHTRWVQSTLNNLLGLRLPIDGIMSPAVRSAVRAFQRREGLPEDGIVGPPTEAALARAAGGSTASGDEPTAANGNGAPAANGNGGPPPDGAEPAGDGGEEQFVGGLWDTVRGAVGALAGAGRIIDRTAHSPKSYRVGKPRDMKKVYALVLHQMAFSRGSDPTKYDKVKSHFAILPDGKILQLHPESALLMASNGFNTGSVAVEFAGNFPSTRGKCWAADRFGCHKVTREQIEAGRFLIGHLMRTMGLTHVLAHRQSSATRENDPGPDIWYHVGQWAVDTHGLKDGGPGFKVGGGNPIPELWRTWGKAKPSPELEAELDELDGETLDPESPEHTRWLQRALNGALGLRLPEDGRMSPAVRSAVRALQRRRGLPADGELSDELEGELVALGAPDHSHGEGEAFIGDLWGKVSGYFSGGSGATGGAGSRPSAPSSGGASYTPARPPATPDIGSTLRSNMAAIARQEWERWKRGTVKEGDPAIRAALADYWKSGAGYMPTGSTWWSDNPWSAAFISWVVRRAGAGSSFKYSAGHSYYTVAAKQNRLAGNSNPFKAFRTGEAAPRVGDIVCLDRGSGATYDNLREGMATHCDIVVEVQPGKLTTIGGNLSDSVRTTTVPTDGNGRISKPGYFAVIRVGG